MSRFRHLYGPVPPRRLGWSLGIDLVPHKICTYDCIYCQIGRTTGKVLSREEYVPVKEILEEVNTFLKEDHLPSTSSPWGVPESPPSTQESDRSARGSAGGGIRRYRESY
jgi:wyosine [tRNA(Phe)-imidazoG37] synthetase (radical SAM superfamily)